MRVSVGQRLLEASFAIRAGSRSSFQRRPFQIRSVQKSRNAFINNYFANAVIWRRAKLGSSFRCQCSAPRSPDETAHIQLATAKLPKGVDVKTFGSKLYQWASTLTYQGRNLPFALPFRTNPLDTGFELSLLRINNSGRPVSIGDIVATVEQEPDVGNVLFVRFYDTKSSGLDRRTPLPSNAEERLRVVLTACVDVPIIMNSLPGAIRTAVAQSRA